MYLPSLSIASEKIAPHMTGVEETCTSEEVRIVQDHTDEDEETCAQRGDEELLAGADAAEEATTETTDEHQTPIDGSQKCCI